MQSADGYAEVDIYTVAGRRIAAFRNIPAEAGYNSLWWNCADSDGDPVASGSYVYRLGAASGTASAEATGIIAIVR
jgi:flagellar hook assembly protein FlgD